MQELFKGEIKMSEKDTFYEEEFFKVLDNMKFLFYPDKWQTNILEYSKNEILAMTYIYRRKKVKMSEIAEYLMAPLNTVTGIINRLEKRGIVERTRDQEDRRIVNISLTEKGCELFNKEKEELIFYFKEIYNELNSEEKILIAKIFSKVINILKNSKREEVPSKKNISKIRKINIE